MTITTPIILQDLSGNPNVHKIGGTIKQNSSNLALWEFIDNSTHEVCGFTGAEVTASGDLELFYRNGDPINGDAVQAISFRVDPDETLAKDFQFTVGPSVGMTNCVIKASATIGGVKTNINFGTHNLSSGNLWVGGEFRGTKFGPTTPHTESASQAYFDACPITPVVDRQKLVNNLIFTLKERGIWAKIKSFMMFAADDVTNALIDWKNPLHSAVAHNSPTFIADRGFVGNDLNAYIATGIIPTAVGAARDNISFGVWCEGGSDSGEPVLGEASGTPVCMIYPRTGLGYLSGRISCNTTAGSGNFARSGLVCASRGSSTFFNMFRNGTNKGSNAVVSTHDPDRELVLLRTQSAYTDDRVLFFYVGTYLSMQDHADLYCAVRTYLLNIGAL